jgi:hypothetical protein
MTHCVKARGFDSVGLKVVPVRHPGGDFSIHFPVAGFLSQNG